MEESWPIGRVATKLLVFSRKENSKLIELLKLFHEVIKVIHPNDEQEITLKYKIITIPTVIFLWKDKEIGRFEGLGE